MPVKNSVKFNGKVSKLGEKSVVQIPDDLHDMIKEIEDLELEVTLRPVQNNILSSHEPFKTEKTRFRVVFDKLSNNGSNDVQERELVKEIENKFQISKYEAEEIVDKALQGGLIFEKRSGIYTRM